MIEEAVTPAVRLQNPSCELRSKSVDVTPELETTLAESMPVQAQTVIFQTAEKPDVRACMAFLCRACMPLSLAGL